ncbi:MFS transporter, partial [Escherichia coli]|uniref:MFS transporter n=1 Tax=Escherichia coli TaxID=562 RepID=UPI00190ADD8C
LAQPIASALSALLLAVAWSSGAWLFAALCVAIAAMVLPLLLNPAMLVASAAPAVHHAHQGRRSLVLAWASRLLVQLSGNVLFYYLLYYFAAVADAPSQHMAPRVAQLVAIAFAVAAPLAVVAGRWSDRSARRKPPILAAAVAMAGGLAMMALAEEWHVGAAGFVLYACGNACFLS